MRTYEMVTKAKNVLMLINSPNKYHMKYMENREENMYVDIGA